jgi:pyruvate/2-oxoacid:ferredoxin oxidoreductase alpha subunit
MQRKEKLQETYYKHINAIMIMMGTNSTTIRVITCYLRSLFQNTETLQMEDIAPAALEHLKKTINEQNAIEWDQ